VERRTFALGLLAAPLGIAALTSAAPVAADDHDDDDERRDSFRRIPVQGTGQDGSFSGFFTIDHFAESNGALVAVGSLSGLLTQPNGRRRRVQFDSVSMPASLDRGTTAAAADGEIGAMQVACPILNLVLGPLDLNLLGLRIQLNQVVLNITAEPGPGNLLGNLLCAIAGLLNGTQTLQQIVNFLNALLALLRG
jgi:hypothetical protein